MKPVLFISTMSVWFRLRHGVLLTLLLGVVLVQQIPGWGEYYARHLYPFIGSCLSSVSQQVPFALGDLFIALSLLGLVVIPCYAVWVKHCSFCRWLAGCAEYLAWIYVWFYLAWGLNYAQADLYQRTGIQAVATSEPLFRTFARQYVDSLNASFTHEERTDRDLLCREVVAGYQQLAPSLGVHAPFHASPQVKPMLFSALASKVGVAGSMAPFFTEFTVNTAVPARQYPFTYAHELAHWLGITSESEANFYAYQVCTRSRMPSIRYSGYLALLPHLLSNARRLLPEPDYLALVASIRPEVLTHYERHRTYWASLYSPVVGKVQHWLYELYLRGNRISDGTKSYSQVVGLLVAYEHARGRLLLFALGL